MLSRLLACATTSTVLPSRCRNLLQQSSTRLLKKTKQSYSSKNTVGQNKRHKDDDNEHVVMPPSSMSTTSSADQLPTPYEHVVGKERLEMLQELSGKQAFLDRPMVVDHYGTLKDPIKVDTIVGERLVGCTGFPKYSHDPVWMWVRENSLIHPKRCCHCGQAFQINKLDDSLHPPKL